MLEGREGVVH
jgi:hypothetical protein